ncbi:MAG: hypothetical protein M0Z31_01865 [Clostridia bacterium]|nr:hypothetical protein [Clostridia bacterium]
MSEFGPWYGGADSDIDDLISSADKLLDLDAKYYMNSHIPQVFSKEEFRQGLKHFLDTINHREKKIAALVKKGYSFTELCSEGLFYKQKYLSYDWVKIWETVMIMKHLQRMNMADLIVKPGFTEKKAIISS